MPSNIEAIARILANMTCDRPLSPTRSHRLTLSETVAAELKAGLFEQWPSSAARDETGLVGYRDGCSGIDRAA